MAYRSMRVNDIRAGHTAGLVENGITDPILMTKKRKPLLSAACTQSQQLGVGHVFCSAASGFLGPLRN